MSSDDLASATGAPSEPMWVWVRWTEFSGWSPWIQVLSVEVDGSWLVVVQVSPKKTIWVPDHIVRGQVEAVQSADRPGKAAGE